MSKQAKIRLAVCAAAAALAFVFIPASGLASGLFGAPGKWVPAENAPGVTVDGKAAAGDFAVSVNEHWTGTIKNGDCKFRYEKGAEYYTLAFYVVEAQDHQQLGDQAMRLKNDLSTLYQIDVAVSEEKIGQYTGYRLVFDLEGIREEWFSFFAGDKPYGLFTESTKKMNRLVSRDLETFVSKLSSL